MNNQETNTAQTVQLPPTLRGSSGPTPSVEPCAVVVTTRHANPGKCSTSKTVNSRFRGFTEFAQVAQEKLAGHKLPSARVKLTIDGLREWLPTLGVTERQYKRLVDMSLEKSVKWNSHWPLVSWLGVVLEMKEGAEQCGH